jgi:RNA polymerase sigma factor (sigma-70 family)
LKSTLHDVSRLLVEQGERLHALLFRLTLRIDVVDDLLQELFCKLATSHGFQRADNPAAFAYRAATNLAFDWRRARKRSANVELSNGEPTAPSATPLADMVRREELEQTLTAIGELPVASRDIIVLRYLEQQSYQSIAQQFGRSEHQIRALAHKVIERLRRCLSVESKQHIQPKPTAPAQRMEEK